MSLNGLSERSIRRVARQANIHPGNILRATVVSHHQHWLVWLTLVNHWHAVYDRSSQELDLFVPGPIDGICTSLCHELFPEDFD